ncbi:MAG: hypothetical protein JWM99_2710 [Verrucomicrobiales bacterium]|nr:hypothetical protein [Verrucomicrobiales bacterium]
MKPIEISTLPKTTHGVGEDQLLSSRKIRFNRFKSAAALFTAIGLITTATPSASAVTIDFSSFPGSDNTLGTGDDLSIVAGTGDGQAAFFTDQFSHLSGGTGFRVDSPVPGGAGLGAIVPHFGNNILVEARPDAGLGYYSFSAVNLRFVLSSDGLTPVGVPSVGFDFVSGISGGASDTAKFYDVNNTLLTTQTYVDGIGNNHISYSNPSGIARVDITTTFSVALDNVSYTPGAAVPDAGSTAGFMSLGCIGLWAIGKSSRRSLFEL